MSAMRAGTVVRDPSIGLLRVRALVLTCVAVWLSYHVARGALGQGFLLVLLVLAVAVLVLSIARPVFLAGSLLVLGATVFSLPLGRVSLGGVRSDVPELIAGALVTGWLCRLALRRERLEGEFVAPVLMLVGSAVLGSAWAAIHGVTRATVQGAVKPYLLYLVALVLCGHVRSEGALKRLERIFMLVVTTGCVVVLLVVATGGTVASEGPTELSSLGAVAEGVHRVRPPLLTLLPLAILLVLARALGSGWSPMRLAQMVLFVVVLGLGFNRSSWLPVLVACGLLGLLRPGPRARPTLVAGLLVVVVALPLSYEALANGALGATGRAVAARTSSALTPKVLNESSYQDRAVEDRTALAALSKQPVLGVGVGALFGSRRALYRPDLGYYVYVDRPYLHNSYLYAWLQTGLLGLAAIALLGVRVAKNARRALAKAPPEVAIRVLAVSLAVLANALSAVFQPLLVNRPAITALCFALALARIPVEDEA
jgi:O-antigen ligase